MGPARCRASAREGRPGGRGAALSLQRLATASASTNRYCWVVHFNDNIIDRVRAYLDSAMVARLFAENPIPDEPQPALR